LKLLLLTPLLPWPLEMHGGAQRTALLLEALRLVADVDIAFVSGSEESVERARAARENGEKIASIFFVPDREGQSASLLTRLPIVGKPFRTLQSHLANYQVDEQFSAWLKGAVRDAGYAAIISRYLWPGAVGGLPRLRAVPTLLDWDDLDHLKIRSLIEANPWTGIRGAATKSLVLWKLKKFCVAAATSYDHVWVTKPADRVGLHATSLSVLPNIPFLDNEEVRSEGSAHRRDILFVGTQTYLPNSEALTRFIDRVWPRILAKCPNTRLQVIGPPPAPEIRAQWERSPGVEILGAVPSLVTYYTNAAMSICPIEWGGGSNIKAVESLSYGVPCVVSPYTFNAFKDDFGPATGMICAHSEEEYVQACTDLLTNSQRGVTIGQAGRRVVQSRYSRSRFRELVKEGLVQAGVLGDTHKQRA
jgi:polysaccharide biosynthesis protein PslH